MDLRWLNSKKAASGIAVIPSPIVMDERLVQLLKTPSPNFFIEEGSETLFNEEQFIKAKF